jgi:hypothetical protein
MASRKNRPVTPTGATAASSMPSEASSVRTRSPGFLGSIMGKLQGLHKNPIKHAAVNLANALVEHNDEALPQIVETCEAALAFSRGQGVPVNDRNPFFLMFLSTFTPVAKDIITVHTGGELDVEEARAARATVLSFRERAAPSERQINTKRASDKHEKETNDFLNKKIDVILRAQNFYNDILKPHNRAVRAAREDAEKAERNASIAKMRAKLNKLKAMGGATKKNRSVRNKTRRM